MIKNLKRNDIQVTPFVATKNWSLSNVANEALILLDHTGSDGSDLSIAWERVIFGDGSAPYTSSEGSIALDQQDADSVIYQEGISSSGLFYPENEPININGTYKRLVYTTLKNMFYNSYKDPTKLWGMENLDIHLDGVKRFIGDKIRSFMIPRINFGEKVLEHSVRLTDNSLDNDYIIADDGNSNLFAETNLFSRVQEIGMYGSHPTGGYSGYCDPYVNPSFTTTTTTTTPTTTTTTTTPTTTTTTTTPTTTTTTTPTTTTTTTPTTTTTTTTTPAPTTTTTTTPPPTTTTTTTTTTPAPTTTTTTTPPPTTTTTTPAPTTTTTTTPAPTTTTTTTPTTTTTTSTTTAAPTCDCTNFGTTDPSESITISHIFGSDPECQCSDMTCNLRDICNQITTAVISDNWDVISGEISGTLGYLSDTCTDKSKTEWSECWDVVTSHLELCGYTFTYTDVDCGTCSTCKRITLTGTPP